MQELAFIIKFQPSVFVDFRTQDCLRPLTDSLFSTNRACGLPSTTQKEPLLSPNMLSQYTDKALEHESSNIVENAELRSKRNRLSSCDLVSDLEKGMKHGDHSLYHTPPNRQPKRSMSPPPPPHPKRMLILDECPFPPFIEKLFLPTLDDPPLLPDLFKTEKKNYANSHSRTKKQGPKLSPRSISRYPSELKS